MKIRLISAPVGFELGLGAELGKNWGLEFGLKIIAKLSSSPMSASFSFAGMRLAL